MCESKLFVDGKLVMEDVVKVEIDGEEIRAYNLFGSNVFKGRIVLIDLIGHRIFIER